MKQNEELVQRIAREVMARLEGSGSPASATGGSGTPGDRRRAEVYPHATAAPPDYRGRTFRHPNSADETDRARAGSPATRSPDTVRRFMAAGADRIGGAPGSSSVPDDIAGYIDHTLLKPDATEEQVRKLSAEARRFKFASVCINPSFVRVAAQELRGTDVRVCTVVGFPLGATTPATKAFETRRAIREGATEIDMVINVGALKTGNHALVQEDIEAVVDAAHESGVLVKVIIEAALLTDEEKVVACLLAKEAKADFVKTSTGFASGGATLRDVAIMRSTVGPGMGVKAAGGIRNYADALGMIEAGATRIGASAGVAIVKEARGENVGVTGKEGY